MTVAENYDAIRRRVDAACLASGRAPEDVQLIAVSKTHPLSAVTTVADLGQDHFGESYVQELREKQGARPDLKWHFIGRIQSNKAKHLLQAHRIHALCERRHAVALGARATEPLQCLVAVNLANEPTKSGVNPADALDACRDLNGVDGIAIVGLMTLPPAVDDPEDAAPYFAQLADLARQGRAIGLPLTELSMGMTRDFEVAIHHGATWVRVGTAIFGKR